MFSNLLLTTVVLSGALTLLRTFLTLNLHTHQCQIGQMLFLTQHGVGGEGRDGLKAAVCLTWN